MTIRWPLERISIRYIAGLVKARSHHIATHHLHERVQVYKKTYCEHGYLF